MWADDGDAIGDDDCLDDPVSDGDGDHPDLDGDDMDACFPDDFADDAEMEEPAGVSAIADSHPAIKSLTSASAEVLLDLFQALAHEGLCGNEARLRVARIVHNELVVRAAAYRVDMACSHFHCSITEELLCSCEEVSDMCNSAPTPWDAEIARQSAILAAFDAQWAPTPPQHREREPRYHRRRRPRHPSDNA